MALKFGKKKEEKLALNKAGNGLQLKKKIIIKSKKKS